MNALYINGSLKTQESLLPVRHFQYRGVLDFCNYSCEYCPFSKRPFFRKKMDEDRECLFQLFNRLREEHEDFTFQIVPYGEALIHTYYWEFLARLSQMPNALAVGCQTNTSFPVENMLSVFLEHGGILEKLRLWCTFHPSMTSAEAFCRQIEKLRTAGISLCAGAVADPSKRNVISHLSSLLPEDIYFWLNRMDGLKRPYTTEERTFFEQIDPFFLLEEQTIPAAKNACPLGCFSGFQISEETTAENPSSKTRPKGGTPSMKNIFLRANGDFFACNLSRKKLGNIYDDNGSRKIPGNIDDDNGSRKKFGDNSLPSLSCRACRCFLAYKNRTDLLPELSLFLPYPSFRIIKKYQAAFFDIDHTLIPPGETKIPETTVQILKAMSRYCDLYLATSLPYTAAMKKCSNIRSLLSGGIFAGGADILCRKHYYLWIDEQSAEKLCHHYEKQNFSVHIYKKELPDNAEISPSRPTGIYKITLIPKNKKRTLSEQDITLSDKNVRFLLEDNRIQIINAAAGKRAGVSFLCSHMGYQQERILTCGDSAEDREMAFL